MRDLSALFSGSLVAQVGGATIQRIQRLWMGEKSLNGVERENPEVLRSEFRAAMCSQRCPATGHTLHLGRVVFRAFGLLVVEKWKFKL